MGKIRGTHYSPGIYTNIYDLQYILNRRANLFRNNRILGGKGNNGGNHPFVPPQPEECWVIGMELPATLGCGEEPTIKWVLGMKLPAILI